MAFLLLSRRGGRTKLKQQSGSSGGGGRSSNTRSSRNSCCFMARTRRKCSISVVLCCLASFLVWSNTNRQAILDVQELFTDLVGGTGGDDNDFSDAAQRKDPATVALERNIRKQLLRNHRGLDRKHFRNGNKRGHEEKSVDNNPNPMIRALEWIAGDPYVRSAGLVPADTEYLERFLLATLWFATGGNSTGICKTQLKGAKGWPGWHRRDNWLSPASHVCGDSTATDRNRWVGVQCDYQRKHVTHLTLGQNKLAGSIPRQIALFPMLESVDLSHNCLNGTLPSELGTLSNLKDLRLTRNQLTGTIPTQLGNMRRIERLFLWDNQLSGSIPTQLGRLTNLNQMNLQDNPGLGGTIPYQLGRLTNLEFLFLEENQLTGTIPASFGNLKNLHTLHMEYNLLTGSIPKSLTRMKNMKSLGLYCNDLAGTVPFGFCTKLTKLQSPYVDCGKVTCPCCPCWKDRCNRRKYAY